MLWRRTKTQPQRPEMEEPQTSLFRADESALLREILAWADLLHAAVRQSGASAEADYASLRLALEDVLRNMRNPDKRISRTARIDAMEVLRREGMDQHGFDPLMAAQALRIIASRAHLAARIASEAAPQAQGQDAEEVARLREQVAALQDLVGHLSSAPEPRGVNG